MPDFYRADLRGSRFERVDLSGAQFRTVDLSDVQFRAVYLKGTLMRGVEMVDVDIRGEIENLTINGVDIGPLVNAELDRRYPDRTKMRPTDAAGFAKAWDVVERLWGGTVERAAKFDPELLHESVDGEWSFIETLRHLAFATDSWIRRAILGDPSPWDPPDLPWDEMPDTPGVPRDRDVRPSLHVVLELRRDRMATVRQVIDGLSEESLDGHTKAVEGPGWPEPRSYPVRECLWSSSTRNGSTGSTPSGTSMRWRRDLSRSCPKAQRVLRSRAGVIPGAEVSGRWPKVDADGA